MPVSIFFLHILFFVLLTICAYCIALFFLKTAIAVDEPNERSSHSETTPRSGGVAIVATFFVGILIIYFFGDKSHLGQRYMLSFVVSALSIVLISFLDDLKRKSALLRLSVMLLAILNLMWGGIILDSMSIPGFNNVQLGLFAYPLTFFWILGLTNAVNFMDGLDGLVGGIAAIVALFFMIISYYQGSTFVYISSYTILAGTIGFLLLNFPPAKIFMGDVGSIFLGFVFATLAIIAALYDKSHTSFLVMPLLMFNVIFDTFFTFMRRLIRHENVFQPHKSHLYQLFQRSGYTHLEVSLVHYCFCFLQGLGAFWMVQIPGNTRLYVFIPFLLFQVIYAMKIMRRAKRKGLL